MSRCWLTSPPVVFGSDVSQHLLIHVMRDEPIQRRRVGQRFTEDRVLDPKPLQHVARPYRGVNGAQTVHVRTTQKSEWRDHRPGTDPSYQLEGRYRASVR